MESCRRRARTEAPTFLISLAIRGQCLEIGADHGANTTTFGLLGDVAGPGLALPQCFLKSLDRHGKADLAAIAKAIGNCFGNSENLHRNAFNDMGFDAFVEQAFRETHDANWCAIWFRRPVFAAYSKPHVSRQLIGEAMECER